MSPHNYEYSGIGGLHTSEDLYPGLTYVKCDKAECPFCNPKPKLAELEARINTQSIALNRVQAEREQLRATLATAEGENAGLKKAIEAWKREEQCWQDDLKQLRARVTELEHDLAEASRSFDLQVKLNDQLRARLSELEQKGQPAWVTDMDNQLWWNAGRVARLEASLREIIELDGKFGCEPVDIARSALEGGSGGESGQ